MKPKIDPIEDIKENGDIYVTFKTYFNKIEDQQSVEKIYMDQVYRTPRKSRLGDNLWVVWKKESL